MRCSHTLSRTTRCLFAGLIGWSVVACALPQEDGPPNEYFPLIKGSYSIYSAQVEWTEGDSSKGNVQVRRAEITWKSEMVDVFERGRIRAARIRGFVYDLAWYEPSKPPGDYVILQVGTNHYHVIQGNTEEMWNRIVTSNGFSYLEELCADNLMLEVPLAVGAVFGDFTETPRGAYCNLVTDEHTFDPGSVKGALLLPSAKEFLIRYWTNPDHSITGFVPGLGVTSFVYRHHGTVANCQAKLIEVHRP